MDLSPEQEMDRLKEEERRNKMETTKLTQSRWKSKVLWAAIIIQVVAFAGMFGVYDLIGVTSQWVQGVLTGILELLVLFGVINSPTTKDGL